MPENAVDPNLARAVYSLVSVLLTNVMIGWGRSFFSKYKLFRQLSAEVEGICRQIQSNADLIVAQRATVGSFPLLAEIRTPIHLAKIGDIIVYEKIGRMASGLISNCEHYNRIIDLGERDADKVKRKSEVLNQGALLHNMPVQVFGQHANGDQVPYIGSAELYLKELRKMSNRYLKVARWFPWYLIILWSEKHHADPGPSTPNSL